MKALSVEGKAIAIRARAPFLLTFFHERRFRFGVRRFEGLLNIVAVNHNPLKGFVEGVA
jgi:hypothetical protein